MSLAASSYARVASFDFSNVRSHTLVFLDITNMYTHEKFLQYKNLKNSHPQDVWSLLSLSLPRSRNLSPLCVCMVSLLKLFLGYGSFSSYLALCYVGTKTCATWAHENRITWAHFGMFRIMQDQCKRSKWVAWLAYFPILLALTLGE